MTINGGFAIAFFLVTQNASLGATFRKDFLAGNGAPIAGDFNGDGKPDLVMGSSFLLNTGAGTFLRKTGSDLAGLDRILAADFNKDGKLDLLANSADSPRSFRVFLGRGDGTFLPPLPGIDASSIAIGDFNSDGFPDLAASPDSSCDTSSEIRILLGNGDGSFRQVGRLQTLCGGTPVVADFNRDGKPDVAWAHGGLSVFPGRGDGTFEPPIVSPAGGTFVTDLNRDGAPDIVTTGGTLLGRGDGTFEPLVRFIVPLSTGGQPVAAGDFNDDGAVDLVVHADGRTWIFPGKGDGALFAAELLAEDSNAREQAAVDLDGDGLPDLILRRSNAVTLLLSDARNRPSLARAISAASGTAIVAPGSLATLYGPFPTELVDSGAAPWPAKLGGLSLEVLDSAGARRLAPLLYVSGKQVNFMVPTDVSLGEASLFIVGEKDAIPAGTMQVEAISPGVFYPIPARLRIPADDATGTIIVSVYGTGFRSADLRRMTCSLYFYPWGRSAAQIEFAGPAGLPGVDRIDIHVPVELLRLMLRSGSYSSIAIQIELDGIPANNGQLDGDNF